MTKGFHWIKEDYFPFLLQNFKNSVLALEYLVDDLHNDKDQTIAKFLSHSNSQEFLWGIIKLMASDNLRVSGNSAYVFGTIAETVEGINRILYLLNDNKHPESVKVLFYLVKLLKSSDYECMMNAAGTIGTISENNVGRTWLIAQPLLDEVIELSTVLLDNQNIWVSSNAALVIARITIEENGCEKILTHKISERILQKLTSSLGCDNAGRGMNCAFAIGRICDHENGRLAFLKFTNTNKLVESLSQMIELNVDNGCTKNACYALSCLAVNQQTHETIIHHCCFLNLIKTLCKLLLTVRDPETQWFAAMLLRIFCAFPTGCVKLKGISIVWQTLTDLYKHQDLYNDVREEITIVLDTLRPLEKPKQIKATVKGNSKIYCEWEKISLKNKLTINYLLYKDDVCIYNGPENNFSVENLDPFTEYSFQIQIQTEENNERSDLSDPVTVQTEESIPSEPLNLRVIGSTTSLIRIAWDPPQKMNGVLKAYFVYNGENLVEQTNDLSSIITGLLTDTCYEFFVCASTNKGKGEKASIKANTCCLGDVLPEKPIFGLIGRREILVRWQPPQVINGKLTRYELVMNSNCVYSGIAQEYQVTMLKPDNEYRFEVIAITTDGKFRSKISKVRTLKDEYDPERAPLYPGPSSSVQAQPVFKEKSPERKKSSINMDKTRIIFTRQRTKAKINKEIAPATASCEEFGLEQNYKNSNQNTKNIDIFINDSSIFSNENSVNTNYNYLSQKRIFPPLANTMPSENSKNDFYSDESLYISRPVAQRGKTIIDFGRKGNNKVNSINTSITPINRSKTQISINQNSRKSAQQRSPMDSATYLQPTNFQLDLKEISPKFPLIPLITSNSFIQNINNYTNEKLNLNNLSNSNNQISQLKINTKVKTKSTNSDSRTSSKSIDKKLEQSYEFQYHILMNKLKNSKALEIDESLGTLVRSNSHVNR